MTREERCRLLLREIVDAWHHSIGTDVVRPDRLRAAIADAEKLLAEPESPVHTGSRTGGARGQ